jgi:hypothetical protein
MRSIQVLIALTAIFLVQSVVAQSEGGVPGLQAQIDALAPNASVAGRMYCRTRSDTILIPNGALNRRVIKQVWGFDLLVAGMVTIYPVSSVAMNQGSAGPNTRTGTVGGTQVAANYLQSGNHVTITFVSSNVANLLVSADGSLAYGWTFPSVSNLAVNIQIENTLVEIGSPAECVADTVTDYP